MILKYRIALLQCCLLLFFSACWSVPPPAEQLDPPPVADVAPAPAEESVGTLREALRKSSVILSGGIESGASVAVISVNSDDSFEGEYAMEELALLFFRMRSFRIVDRKNVDIIRAEQRFRNLGEIDDDTAVFIGGLVGAAFVVTGGISREPPGLRVPAKRLRLRVLDVRTGQICAVSSIAFLGEL
jgi:hypothetical protein